MSFWKQKAKRYGIRIQHRITGKGWYKYRVFNYFKNHYGSWRTDRVIR